MNAALVMLVAAAACLATFAGGLTALRFRDHLHLILGFSAGAIVAMALFELIPESVEIGAKLIEPRWILTCTGLAFFAYAVMDRSILVHAGTEKSLPRGWTGAASLSVHSVMDGFAMGIGFQVSPAVGVVIAAAVLAHDCSDGINTVNLVIKNGGTAKQALRWLASDALAPVLGAAISLLIRLPQRPLSLAIATFGGFFLYIGASDLLPESHHAHPKFLTTVMTLLGAGFLFAVIHLAE